MKYSFIYTLKLKSTMVNAKIPVIFSYYMPRKPRYYLDIVSKNIVIPYRPVKAVDPLP